MYTYFREEILGKVDHLSLFCAPFLSLVHPANGGSKLSAGKGLLYFDHVPPFLLPPFPGYYGLVSILGTTVRTGMASSTQKDMLR